MTKTTNSNYGSIGSPGNTFDRRISADTDTFSRNDIDALGMAVDDHDHSSGKGLPVTTIPSGYTLGIGTAAASYVGLAVSPSTLSGSTTQYMIVGGGTFGSSATAGGVAFLTGINTAAASFTMTTGICFQCAGPTLGAGSAITTQYGIEVQNQGASGVTNAYGVYIAAQSGASTTNVGLYCGGSVQLASLGSFATGDKYVIVDSSGNLHKSSLGPAS